MKKSLLLFFFVSWGISNAQQVSFTPALDDNGFQQIYLLEVKWDINYNLFSTESQWFPNPYDFTIYQLISSGEKGLVLQSVPVIPGDSVSYSFELMDEADKWYVMKFTGKNAAHYNYDWQKKVNLPVDSFEFYQSEIDVIDFKKHCQERRDMELDFLEKYRKDNSISADFYEYSRNIILNLYALKLYQVPLYYTLSLLPKNYFDDVVFAKPPVPIYYYTLINKYLFAVEDFPLEHPQKIFNNIQQNAQYNEKEFLLTAFVLYYATSGLDSYRDFLIDVIAEAKETVKNTYLLTNVQLAEQLYSKSGVMLPDSVLDKTYLRTTESDEKISLRTVLRKYKGKPLYIDFWASWCGPCRSDIAQSGKAKRFLKEQGVEILYFSSDTDTESWLKAIKTDNISGHHYMCFDNRKSPIYNYFNVSGIPHYVLLDKEHKAFVLNAPRSNEDELNRLQKIVKMMIKE